MIYIYIELQYQRQLSRICPEVLESFFSVISASVHRNGGTEIWISGGHLYQFDDKSVGYAFASSRVLGDIQILLEENCNRITEFFALVDSRTGAVTADEFSDILATYDCMITPSKGILLSPQASKQLESYIECTPVPELPLFLYSGLTLGRTDSSDADTADHPPSLSLYTDFVTDPVSTFRNLVCTLPEPDVKQFFSEQEQALFTETRYALEMHSQFRFSALQPEFRTAACIEYLSLFFKSLKQVSGKLLPVGLYGKAPLPATFAPLIEKMGEYCRFMDLARPSFLPVDIDSIPEDLMELAYLVYRSSALFYRDELVPFFVFLGKQSDFLEALGNWMHTYGLMSVPDDFRSLNTEVFQDILIRLGNRTGQLDAFIARFLWLRYEKGLLQPVFELNEIFAGLKFMVPDAFLVNCLYHTPDALSGLRLIRDRFLNPMLVDSVEKLEQARKKYDEGDFSESSALAKNVLHVFQKENVLTGEYRALSLIAMLSLARNRGDDAVVYLEYALENAEKMHDAFSILCTSFDMSMVYFINGNFHFSLCALDTVEKIVGACYAKDWEVLLFFMKGRIAFELGNYRNAELLFQTAASLSSINQIPESVSLCRVWYARSLAHLNRFASADSILAGCASSIPEAYLFLLESALISGRMLNGIAFPESMPPLFAPTDRWTSERISWKSGFTFAEDRCFGSSADSRLLSRMYEAYSLYYRARFAEAEDTVDIVAGISRIARTALDLQDPYAAVYYYFCYDLGIKTPEVLPADTTTFLSRGFKYMQKRANEIEENSVREQYMQNSTWNGRLYRKARENMLI